MNDYVPQDIPLSVDVISTHWWTVGDPHPYDRLLATIVVHGCCCHLEAIRVEVDHETREWQVAQGDLAEIMEAAYEICGDGPFTTASINGFEYVIVATSYAS